MRSKLRSRHNYFIVLTCINWFFFFCQNQIPLCYYAWMDFWCVQNWVERNFWRFPSNFKNVGDLSCGIFSCCICHCTVSFLFSAIKLRMLFFSKSTWARSLRLPSPSTVAPTPGPSLFAYQFAGAWHRWQRLADYLQGVGERRSSMPSRLRSRHNFPLYLNQLLICAELSKENFSRFVSNLKNCRWSLGFGVSVSSEMCVSLVANAIVRISFAAIELRMLSYRLPLGFGALASQLGHGSLQGFGERCRCAPSPFTSHDIAPQSLSIAPERIFDVCRIDWRGPLKGFSPISKTVDHWGFGLLFLSNVCVPCCICDDCQDFIVRIVCAAIERRILPAATAGSWSLESMIQQQMPYSTTMKKMICETSFKCRSSQADTLMLQE